MKLRHDVVYIVAGVVVEGDKVLLIQEAKPVCRGDWYLPAGRMEVNETIVVRYMTTHRYPPASPTMCAPRKPLRGKWKKRRGSNLNQKL